jgi:hypothetical protein
LAAEAEPQQHDRYDSNRKGSARVAILQECRLPHSNHECVQRNGRGGTDETPPLIFHGWLDAPPKFYIFRNPNPQMIVAYLPLVPSAGGRDRRS